MYSIFYYQFIKTSFYSSLFFAFLAKNTTFANVKLSIIIPVYNVEHTLSKCIKSVLNQSFHDYQLILVDDGSPDCCPEICDNYKNKDSRIEVIHKSNGGLSSARNEGIKKARGEYITFIDSDDTISIDTLSSLMDIISIHHEYDILEYPVYEHYGSPTRKHLRSFGSHEYNDIEKYWFDEKAYQHTYAWNKIYRSCLFNNVYFPEGHAFEDVYTLPKLLRLCQTVATTNVGLYLYHHNDNGITASAGAKELEDLLAAHIQLAGTPLSPLKSTDYYAHVLNIQIDVYEQTGRPIILPKLTTYRNNISIKITLSKIIGIEKLCQLIKRLHKIRRLIQ